MCEYIYVVFDSFDERKKMVVDFLIDGIVTHGVRQYMLLDSPLDWSVLHQVSGKTKLGNEVKQVNQEFNDLLTQRLEDRVSRATRLCNLINSLEYVSTGRVRKFGWATKNNAFFKNAWKELFDISILSAQLCQQSEFYKTDPTQFGFWIADDERICRLYNPFSPYDLVRYSYVKIGVEYE